MKLRMRKRTRWGRWILGVLILAIACFCLAVSHNSACPSPLMVDGVNLMQVTCYDGGVFRRDRSHMVCPEWCGGKRRWTVNRALAAIPRDEFDYVWMVDVPAFNPGLIRGMTPIWRGKGSMLYRIDR
jgi:hypothetical protein